MKPYPTQPSHNPRFVKMLKAYNISATLVCLLFTSSLIVTNRPFFLNYFLIAAGLGYALSYVIALKNHLNWAFLLFVCANTLLVGTFDGGINSPVYSFAYYIPYVLCSFIAERPQRKEIKWLIWAITISCIFTTAFLDITPHLSSVMFNPEHHQYAKYLNLFIALGLSVLTVRLLIQFATDSETALMKNQMRLQSHQDLLYSINQNINEGIYRSTEDNKIVYVNNAFAKLFSYDSSEEVMGLSSPILYDDPQQRLRLVDSIKFKGYFTDQEVLFLRKDGSKFWGQISCILSTDENGNHFFDGAVRDITKQKSIEAELIQAKNIAEQASLAKSKFLSAMSHEIRTPMNAVIGITNLLMEHRGDLQKQQANLSVLKNSAQNLMSLLNDLLDFSKIEAGKFELSPTYTNIGPDIKELVSMYMFLANQKLVAFETKIQLIETQLICVDSTRLMQVISNLLSNAIKFTQHGSVSLSIIQNLSSDKRSCLTTIRIKDTGIGIEPANQQQIFTAFAQETDETSTHYGGSGLGLAISRRILEKMNSEIYVQSAKGQGAEFWFEIETPAQPVPASQVSLPAEPFLSIRGIRLLLAEDNPINVLIAKQILNSWGVQVTIANNGKEAVDLTSAKSFDVILMDLHMPELSGIEATRIIRQQGISTPIIALTADALFDSKNECIAAGMNVFITKPFNPDELYQLLTTFQLPAPSN